MDNLHLIDYLFAALGGLLSAGWIVLFYALRKNAEGVKETAQRILDEKEKLVAQNKADHAALEEKLVNFRIKVAEEYATTKLVKEILDQITNPITKKLEEIELLLNSKVDRREFERHEARTNGNGG